MNQKWTKEELDFVRANAAVLTDKDGAEKLSSATGRYVSLHSYRKKRQLMGIKKAHGRGICRLFLAKDRGNDVLAKDPSTNATAKDLGNSAVTEDLSNNATLDLIFGEISE